MGAELATDRGVGVGVAVVGIGDEDVLTEPGRRRRPRWTRGRRCPSACRSRTPVADDQRPGRGPCSGRGHSLRPGCTTCSPWSRPRGGSGPRRRGWRWGRRSRCPSRRIRSARRRPSPAQWPQRRAAVPNPTGWRRWPGVELAEPGAEAARSSSVDRGRRLAERRRESVSCTAMEPVAAVDPARRGAGPTSVDDGPRCPVPHATPAPLAVSAGRHRFTFVRSDALGMPGPASSHRRPRLSRAPRPWARPPLPGRQCSFVVCCGSGNGQRG